MARGRPYLQLSDAMGEANRERDEGGGSGA